MTLYRQLLWLLALLFGLLFAGTFTIEIDHLRRFLVEQLAVHAQDTATALALTLSQAPAGDAGFAAAAVDAIFDRGDYSRIVLHDAAGDERLRRELAAIPVQVPGWFARLLPLPAPVAQADIMAGWQPAGEIAVQSQPGSAYVRLWRTAQRLVLWFGGASLLVLAISGLTLHRLLRPLRAVERQAAAIGEHRYERQPVLPRTRELHRVVVAMNRMAAKLEAAFEEQAGSAARLRALAYQDVLTDLTNRRYFERELAARLTADEQTAPMGALAILHLAPLADLNARHGYAAGDLLIKAAAKVLVQQLAPQPNAVIARIGGADFGLLLAQAGPGEAEALLDRIGAALGRLHADGVSDAADVGHLGLTRFAVGDTPAAVLAQADSALRRAQQMGPNCWQRFQGAGSASGVPASRQDARNLLQEALREQRLLLHAQPVRSAVETGLLLHHELFARLPDRDGRLLTAGEFVPLAAQSGLGVELDRAVAGAVLALLPRLPPSAMALNLASASLEQAAFRDWLLTELERRGRAVKGRLLLELGEQAALSQLDLLRDLRARLRRLGVGFGIDHFGRGGAAFGYLQSLRPDYVKLDATYTRALRPGSDDEFFVSALVRVAHNVDIEVIAEAVEDAAHGAILTALGIDGLQGYAIGRPAPLADLLADGQGQA